MVMASICVSKLDRLEKSSACSDVLRTLRSVPTVLAKWVCPALAVAEILSGDIFLAPGTGRQYGRGYCCPWRLLGGTGRQATAAPGGCWVLLGEWLSVD